MSDAELKARLKAVLDPVGSWRADARPDRSDFDLNPSVERAGAPLRPAAVLVPIVARPEGATLLLTRRSDTLTKHTGQIAFPGGRLDPGENAVEAALREATEEIDLAPEAVEILGLGASYETVTGFCVTPVVGWIESLPPLKPSPAEVAEVFETPWAFLMDAANHRRDFLDPEVGGRRWFWAMPWGDRYIWGATAGMLREIYGRLHPAAEGGAEDAA